MSSARLPLWGWVAFGAVIGLIVGVANDAIVESVILCVLVLTLVGVATVLLERLRASDRSI